MIGSHIAHYSITEKLGEGEVYRARDTKLNRYVALKILPQVFAQGSQRMARFEREAQVLASFACTPSTQSARMVQTESVQTE
jgi:serine/threonine protein kinase